MIDTEDMRREGKEASGLRCGEYCVEAADEIERLQVKLAYIRGRAQDGGMPLYRIIRDIEAAAVEDS